MSDSIFARRRAVTGGNRRSRRDGVAAAAPGIAVPEPDINLDRPIMTLEGAVRARRVAGGHDGGQR
ncbi:MAG: hypothetical protein WA459_20010 [Stellaceae bacterium]